MNDIKILFCLPDPLYCENTVLKTNLPNFPAIYSARK